MTREEAVELLPIIQAFSVGKPIQYRVRDNESANWNDIGENYHEFSPYSFQYRIKPEPQFRPFKDTDECWAEMQKHQPFGWVKDRNGSKFVIENVDSRGFVEVCDEGTCTFKEVFENRTFVDGLPFGVKVDG